MKKKILTTIEHFLQYLARVKIRRAKPKIIVITGSYGKTTTKEAVYFLLRKKFGSDIGKNWGNMNSTLGLPLAILGLKQYSFGLGFLLDLLIAKWNFLFYRLPKILVLELGIDKPGEMSELLSMFSPDISILTGISETHLEGFESVDTIKKEKGLIFQSLKTEGVAIVNDSDKNSLDIEIPTSVKKVYFGRKNTSLASASNFQITVDGTKFELKLGDKKLDIDSEIIGEHSINCLLIAATIGDIFNINSKEIKESLEEIASENGRMKILKTKNQITIIDDSYNSNPRSADEALNTLKQINFSGRKVAILGNMNELGNYEIQGHTRVGQTAGKIVDLLIVVGKNAPYYADGAKKSGLNDDKILIFKTTNELIDNIDKILSAGDIVLIKGSQNNVRFEKVVSYLLNDENLAKKSLVRQENKWKNK